MSTTMAKIRIESTKSNDKFIYDDGGRAQAGFDGLAGDCVTRSIAIAAEKPYLEVYRDMANLNQSYRGRSKSKGRRTARNGIVTSSVAFKRYMTALGFTWTATMKIGTGCRVHLRADELPTGRLVVRVSKHMTAVIDGKIRDTFDPRREVGGIERRCVYGYWRMK